MLAEQLKRLLTFKSALHPFGPSSAVVFMGRSSWDGVGGAGVEEGPAITQRDRSHDRESAEQGLRTWVQEPHGPGLISALGI